MRTFKEEALNIIRNLNNENIRFLNLLDRIGYEKMVRYTSEIMTKAEIEKTIYNISEKSLNDQYEDNIDILENLVYLENPFAKDAGFKAFYCKTLANGKPLSSFENVYEKDTIDGIYSIKDGIYKNIFSGMAVKIENGETNLAIYHELFDRLKKKGSEKIILKDEPFFENVTKMSKYYTEKEIKVIEKEFVLYHELAHLSGIQTLTVPQSIDDKNPILKETHSDICGIIKTIQSNNMNKEEAIALLEDVLLARSHYKVIGYELFNEDNNKYIDHMTHVGLFILKDFINKDLEYIKKISDNDMTKFAWILTEQAHQPSYLEMLEEDIRMLPNDKEKVEELLKNEMLDGQSFLGKLFNYYQDKNPDRNLVEVAASKLVSDTYISIDMSIRILKLFNQEKLLNIKFPFSEVLRDTIKDDFNFFKDEYNQNQLKLSKIFDSKELIEKSKNFKQRLI